MAAVKGEVHFNAHVHGWQRSGRKDDIHKLRVSSVDMFGRK